ncbi:MAG: pseudouridine synthase [Gammaproteobacteria bacterium]|nr:MAG: pseudouridine synthase [Gammaproteobacteria bacterium]
MPRIVLFNKPYNVLSQFTDPQGRDTLAKYISDKDLHLCGRLDYDSEGLLLLSDSGRLQHLIAHPHNKKYKRYWVQVEGIINDDAINRLKTGVLLNDGMTLPAQARQIPPPPVWTRNPPIRVRKTVQDSWIELAIREGKNRQVRRMTAAVGFPTLRLIRYQIDQWQLGSLQPGELIGKPINLPAKPKTPLRMQPSSKQHSRAARKHRNNPE